MKPRSGEDDALLIYKIEATIFSNHRHQALDRLKMSGDCSNAQRGFQGWKMMG